MSSYSQIATYSQVTPPSHAYASLPPPYPYPVPPVQPTYLINPNAFRHDFSTRLAELTVNSRPIIQSLSTIAQDYSCYADIVVQCVQQHIRRVSFFPLVGSDHELPFVPCVIEQQGPLIRPALYMPSN